MRDKVLKWALDTYGSTPESLWAKTPDDVVLRHQSNKKWYAILMKVRRSVLGLDGDEIIDIINVKCDTLEIDFLSQQQGFFKGYHMNKNHWLTILLDGSVPLETVCGLIEQSFDMTAPKLKKKK
jgi:predicted DNA-binding protein (MmcQ/YjbR family)